MLTDSTQEKLALQDIPVLMQVFNVPTIAAMSIHSRIRELRTQQGMSMKDVGDRVGVQWQTVQQWEKEGGTAPRRTRLKQVADALGTTPEHLIGATAQEPAWPFKHIDEAKFRALEDEDQDALETAMLAVAHYRKIDIATKESVDIETGSL